MKNISQTHETISRSLIYMLLNCGIGTLRFLLIHTFPSLDAISVFNVTKQSQVDAEIHMLKVLPLRLEGLEFFP